MAAFLHEGEKRIKTAGISGFSLIFSLSSDMLLL